MCAVKINGIGRFDLNPRGNLWLKDENRFGHKLLTKLGWSEGKGLGKDENGVTENLKVRMKRGNSGVGWAPKTLIGVESNEFDVVLEKLNKKFQTSNVASSKNLKDDKSTKSLEQRSQQFRNRLHYKKFLRGKDVCRYSEKEMAAIFVKKIVEPKEGTAPKKTTVTNVDNCSEECSEPESVPTFKSRLSMKEYFEMKLGKKSNGELEKETHEAKDDSKDTTGEQQVSRKKRKKESKKAKYQEDAISDNIALLQEQCEDVTLLDQEYDNAEEGEHGNTVASIPKKETHETKEDSKDTTGEVSRRKRKKGLEKSYKSKKAKYEDAISDNTALLQEECEDVTLLDKEYNNDEEGEQGNTVVSIPKKEKRKKSKSSKIKSCLKRTTDMWFNKEKKEVSFNDSISFKIINNRFGDEVELDATKGEYQSEVSQNKVEYSCRNGETSHPGESGETDISYLSDESEKEKSAIIEKNETENLYVEENKSESSHVEENGLEHLHEEKNELNDMITNITTSIDTPWKDNFSESPKCFDLPKCNTSNYNTWLETQRLAIKMKLYKNLVKKLKLDPVLCTSNLLDIKGYGNWGFK